MLGLLLLVLLVPACSGLRLTAMTFNLFYGGTSLNLTDGSWCHPRPHGCPGNLERVAAAIRFAGADVVGLEETEGNTEAVAALLGWHWSARAHVVSRFRLAQLSDEPNPLRAALVEAAPGAWLLLGVAHAPSDPYGPYLVRDNVSLATVLALERDFRAPPVLDFAGRLAARAGQLGLPWLLVGDFNCPSQLDWTPAAVAARGLPRPVVWPLGLLLAQRLGALDAFRAVRPDPAAAPGITWTPWGPEDEPPLLEIDDRVDWILAGPGVAPRSADVVGAPGAWRFWPWPSDHYAVRAELELQPARALRLAAAHSRVTPDVPLPVFCNDSALAVTLDGTPLVLPAGWSNLSVAALAEGVHVLAAPPTEVRFWVVRSPTSIAMADPTVYSGNPIPVMIRNAPGQMLDYLAVYPCGGSVNSPAVYVYTEALISGTVIIQPPFYNEGNHPLWPLPPGCYAVALLRDDDPTARAAQAISFIVAPPLLAWYVYVAPVIAVLLMLSGVVLLCLAYRRRKDARFEHI